LRSLQEKLASIWEALNPPEPTPKYLATFMGTVIVLFTAAYLIGQALAAA